jgi:putative N6-adenine-specific DNA methylase
MMPEIDPAFMKRIKRHVIGRRRNFFAVVAPGTEALCRHELEAPPIGLASCQVTRGGVEFTGRPSDCYRANLHTRLAVRILMRLTRFRATNFRRLEKKVRGYPWELYLQAGSELIVKGTSRHSRLYHRQAIAEKIKKAVTQRLEPLGLAGEPAQPARLFFRFKDDTCLLSLDSSGTPLYQRGIKTHRARAPLRETLASAVLLLAGFEPDMVLVDPMCGAGTFSLEAALMVKGIPPGWFRSFAFEDWPAFRPNQWAHFKKTAANQIQTIASASIFASDRDPRAVEILSASIKRHKLDDVITVSRQNIFDLTPPKSVKGLIVINPPYGIRLGNPKLRDELILTMLHKFRRQYRGWRLALIVPDEKLVRKQPIQLKSYPIHHGGLRLYLLTGSIP